MPLVRAFLDGSTGAGEGIRTLDPNLGKSEITMACGSKAMRGNTPPFILSRRAAGACISLAHGPMLTWLNALERVCSAVAVTAK
jgi:hypothetical protein